MNRDSNGSILVLFKCQCGAEVLIRRSRADSYTFCSSSCLLLRAKRIGNMIGQKFGKWVVLGFTKKAGTRAATYECQCSCGTIKILRGGDLRYGATKSCGHSKITLEEKKTKQRIRSRNWYKENPACRSKSFRRHRTPKWLSKEHRQVMNSIYKDAQQLTQETGIKYVVDHIVPLRGMTVSGLHVPWNLQIVTEAWNLKKSNRYAELWSDPQKCG